MSRPNPRFVRTATGPHSEKTRVCALPYNALCVTLSMREKTTGTIYTARRLIASRRPFFFIDGKISYVAGVFTAAGRIF
jgi:hypothetical protein